MPKVNCKYCNGRGIYTGTDSGYGTDRYYEEPCSYCNRTGIKKIEVSKSIYKEFKVETTKELKKLLDCKITEVIKLRNDIRTLKKYLEK